MPEPEISPLPSAVPTPAQELLELPLAPQLLNDEDTPDGDEIVEAAEQLLREGAPHDFDLLVIGGGPGGYVCALRAAQLGSRVGLIENREIGGVCLNRGCIPTKTLLESVDVLRLFKHANHYGITLQGAAKPDFSRMTERKNEVIANLRSNVEALLNENSVTVLRGSARFVEEHTVEIQSSEETRRVTAVHVVIATGSLPARLPVEGAHLPGVVTSDELLEMTEVPRHLVTIGAGAVGVEFAYLFKALGSQSTILEKCERALPQEDEDIAREMEKTLRGLGVQLELGVELQRIESHASGLHLFFSRDGEEHVLDADCVLVASGRKANTQGLGLEEAGIEHDNGRILVDQHCETSVSGVYAIGDVTRDVGWAHQASSEGKAVAERICGRDSLVDLEFVPSCYYTHPEIASVGLTEAEAREQGYEVRVGKFPFRANGRAASAGEHEGFVKIVIEDETEMLLGAQIIGPRATELINEVVMALKNRATVEDLVGSMHAHPTFSEALPEAALQALHGSQE